MHTLHFGFVLTRLYNLLIIIFAALVCGFFLLLFVVCFDSFVLTNGYFFDPVCVYNSHCSGF